MNQRTILNNRKKNWKNKLNPFIKNIIWIDENNQKDIHKKYYKILISKFPEANIIFFEKLLDGLNKLNLFSFQTVHIIISGKLFQDYLFYIKKNLCNLKCMIVTIIFTSSEMCKIFSNQPENEQYIKKETYQFLGHDFYNYGLFHYRFNEIVEFFENYEKQMSNNFLLYPIIENKKKITYENIYIFQEIKNSNDLILFSLYDSISKKIIETNESEIKDFIIKCLQNYNNPEVSDLFLSFTFLNNIPYEILSKYFIRLYTLQNKFYNDINNSLLNNEEKYFSCYIKMLYKGLEIKSLKYFNLNECNIYRGSYIDKNELNLLKKYYKNVKDNLPSSVLYSKSFLSFSKNDKNAVNFLKNYNPNPNTVPVFFIITKKKPYKYNNISNADLDSDLISRYLNEKEVLFFPFSCFTVEKIIENYDLEYENKKLNCNLIYLDYLGRYEDKIIDLIFKTNEEDLNNEIKKSKFFDDIKKSKNIKNLENIFIEEFKYITDQKEFSITTATTTETKLASTGVDNICNICIFKNKKFCYLDKYCTILKIRDFNNFKLEIYDRDSNSKINYIMELSDGRILICYLDFLIKIIEIDYINKNYKFTNILKGHSNLISKVIELKNGYLCSCSFDGYIKLWKKNKDNLYEFEINLKLFEEGKFYSLLEVNEIIFSLLDFNNKKILYIMDLNKREERKKYLQNINLKRENLIKLDDNNLLVGGNYVIYIYNINKNEEININCNYIICSLYVLKDNGILLGDNIGNLIKIKNLYLSNFEIIFKKKQVINDEIDSLGEFENGNIFSKNKKKYIISKIV